MKGIENGNHGKLIRFELGGPPLSKSDEFAVVAILYTLHSHPSQILIYQKTRHLLGAEPRLHVDVRYTLQLCSVCSMYERSESV